MNLIFRISWRNIFRHKRKTIVIGTILFLGSLIMTLGNGVISGMDEGLRKNIVEGFSGDVVIISQDQLSEAVLASMTGQTMEPINNYPQLKTHLEGMDFIRDTLPAGIGYVWVLNESGQPIDQYLLGVDFNDYQAFINNNLEVVEGRYPAEGERGVIVTTTMREWLYDFSRFWVIPKGGSLVTANLTEAAKKDQDDLDLRDELVFLGLSRRNSSQDILAEVIGIVRFKELNKILGFYSIVDIESLREAMGYFSGETTDADLSEEQQSLLGADVNPEAFFESAYVPTDKGTVTISEDMFERAAPQDQPDRGSEQGIYNAVFVKTADTITTDKAIARLNDYFKENNLPVKAVSWKTAIGIMGQMAALMKSALFLFVSFIFFVAIVIIMNTLSMAAMERISEIGMMRAVGARKRFVSRMFLMETFLLAAAFGGAGIVAGIIGVHLLAAMQLTTENEMLQIFYGGDSFQPLLSGGDIIVCIVQLVIVTLLAVIYPVIVARRITPLDAVSRD